MPTIPNPISIPCTKLGVDDREGSTLRRGQGCAQYPSSVGLFFGVDADQTTPHLTGDALVMRRCGLPPTSRDGSA